MKFDADDIRELFDEAQGYASDRDAVMTDDTCGSINSSGIISIASLEQWKASMTPDEMRAYRRERMKRIRQEPLRRLHEAAYAAAYRAEHPTARSEWRARNPEKVRAQRERELAKRKAKRAAAKKVKS